MHKRYVYYTTNIYTYIEERAISKILFSYTVVYEKAAIDAPYITYRRLITKSRGFVC
jgi:hypothetical protein